jgi:hypothetical protein
MVSFDVCALFPSIPENEAVVLLKEWVCDQDISNKDAEIIYELIDIVVTQKFFQFDDLIYQQLDGVEIGGKLSPIVAEIFMSRNEIKILKDPEMPKKYCRFVDDVFAVIKRGGMNEVLTKLNEMHPKIKFTCEREENGKLPFLDLVIGRNNRKFSFEVYHKPCDLNLCTPADSHSPTVYKLAVFESNFHRLFNLPLSDEGFLKEKERIYDMAEVNGYKRDTIEKIEMKHKRKLENAKLTTLAREDKKNDPSSRLMMLNFHPPFTDAISKVAKKHGINAVYKSSGTLSDILVNLKDKRKNEMKSGIYEIGCVDCDSTYIGQSKRRVQERWKEHDAAIRLKQPQKSAVAEHMIECGHSVGEKKLLKEVTSPVELNAWESFYISNNYNLLNLEEAPIKSDLFLFFS